MTKKIYVSLRKKEMNGISDFHLKKNDELNLTTLKY